MKDALDICQFTEEITKVLHRGEPGIDFAADIMAKEHMGIEAIPFRARWKIDGPKGGEIRDREMVARADALVCIWNGEEGGCRELLKAAREKGIRVHECIIPH